ncbi:hypothetical protein EVAR_66870_1 [Eumeta japonica]|uniref:Uncharacterized protein n=1 Tax=Eumeta variegata TaxID=151549 RepID=A0A4C1ZR58_EUMVA|nr:hypothetical protein EVAR_66870_1 [Eumeta japonica]
MTNASEARPLVRIRIRLSAVRWRNPGSTASSALEGAARAASIEPGAKYTAEGTNLSQTHLQYSPRYWDNMINRRLSAAATTSIVEITRGACFICEMFQIIFSIEQHIQYYELIILAYCLGFSARLAISVRTYTDILA